MEGAVSFGFVSSGTTPPRKGVGPEGVQDVCMGGVCVSRRRTRVWSDSTRVCKGDRDWLRKFLCKKRFFLFKFVSTE